MRRHARSPSKRTPCSTLAFLIPICEPKTGNLLIKAPGVPIGNSGVSHARILPYPLRAAAPRRYLRFVRLIWCLGNVYLRFVRLSEHDTLGITVLRLLESCGSRSASTLPSTPRNADSPLFSPLSAPIHLSVRDFQWAIGKGSSQTAPRTVFVLYDDNQLGRDIQGRGKIPLCQAFVHQYPQSMPEGSETVSITRTPAASTCRRSGRAVRHHRRQQPVVEVPGHRR